MQKHQSKKVFFKINFKKKCLNKKFSKELITEG